MYQELSSLGKDREEGVMALVNRALWQQVPAKPPELLNRPNPSGIRR
jgi:hypothetical protein